MDVKNTRCYKNNSNPLEPVKFEELEVGDLFISSRGTRFKVSEPGVFVIDKSTELVEDEKIEDLISRGEGVDGCPVNLFWTLMRNKK